MKTLRYAACTLLITLLAAGWAVAQYYPSDRTTERDNRPPRRRPQQNPTGPTTEGPARAPEEPEELPENRQPIPARADDQAAPPTVEDPNFAKALRAAIPGIVRINMQERRQAIGFLIAGADSEHALVVTNFFAVAREEHEKNSWIDIRSADGSQLEVVGLQNHDELQDLALISVKAPKSRKVSLLELAGADPKPNDKVYSVGYQWAVLNWAAAGQVQKLIDGSEIDAPIGSKWIQTDEVIVENTLGGPLMDTRGKVVGVCTSNGRRGRGPHVSVPVSEIRELMAAESFGSGRFVGPKGAFRWPDIEEGRKSETFSYTRIAAAATAVKRTLECKKCNSHGYLVAPVYQVDPTTGKKTKTGEKNEPCDECGGAGIVLRPGIHDLLSTVTKALLNPDDKIDDGQMAKLRVLAQEGFDRAAVNRLVLANYLTPSANKILGEAEQNEDKAVTFLATIGPNLRHGNRKMYWVRPYDSDLWLLTYDVEPRVAAGTTMPAPSPRPGRRGPPEPQQQRRGQYAMVSGIIKGVTVIDTGKEVYRAVLLKAADIVTLRP